VWHLRSGYVHILARPPPSFQQVNGERAGKFPRALRTSTARLPAVPLCFREQDRLARGSPTSNSRTYCDG
jgi:hypothetical protein